MTGSIPTPTDPNAPQMRYSPGGGENEGEEVMIRFTFIIISIIHLTDHLIRLALHFRRWGPGAKWPDLNLEQWDLLNSNNNSKIFSMETLCEFN